MIKLEHDIEGIKATLEISEETTCADAVRAISNFLVQTGYQTHSVVSSMEEMVEEYDTADDGDEAVYQITDKGRQYLEEQDVHNSTCKRDIPLVWTDHFNKPA